MMKNIVQSVGSRVAIGVLIAVGGFSQVETARAVDVADQAAPQEGTGKIEEVMVTARKREERVQSVPISMDAFTQADLDAKGIKSMQDLRFSSPSVYIQGDSFEQDTVNVTIRGLRNYPNNGIQFDSAAAIYMDSVYLARTQGLEGTLFDLDTVQVLKGPQGTLVGRNSTGGAILYTSKDPQDKFGGYLNMSGGNYDYREVEGVLNIPLSDEIAVRAGISDNDRGGYLQNIYYDPATGQRNNTPALGYRKINGKFAIKYQPDNDFKVLLRANVGAEHDTGSAYHDLGYFIGTTASLSRASICNIPGTCNTVGGTTFTDLLGHVIAPYYSNATGTINTDPRSYNAVLNSVARQANNFWTTDQSVDNEDTDHFQTYSFEVDKSFSAFDLKYLASYRYYDAIGGAVSRGLPYDTVQYSFQTPDYKAYSQEMTANGNIFDDKLKWTAGLFYFYEIAEKQGSYNYLYSPNYPAPAAISGHQVTLTDSTGGGGDNTSYAAYAQGTYNILPEFRLTAGARYTIDERSALVSTTSTRFPATAATTAAVANSIYNPGTYTLNGISYQGYTTSCGLTGTNGKLLPANACAFNISKKFTRPTWTLALDYDLFEHTLLYFTTRSGYKAGAINTGATNAAVTVARPENVQDYELGIKSDWRLGDIPIRTNLAVYDTDYQNIQVQTALPNATFASVAGGGPCTQATFNSALCTGTTTDNVTLNAKSAKIYGYEAQITAIPLRQVQLTYGVSYLHARYTDFSYTIPTGYLLPASGVTNLSGTAFPLPIWEMNASATYALTGEELGGLPVDNIALTANWYWQSKFLATFTGYNYPAQQAAGYGMTNLIFNIDNIKNSGASINTFVTNLFDKKACYPESGSTGGGGAGVLNSVPNATFGTPNTSGVLQCVPLAPQMFGVTVKYVF